MRYGYVCTNYNNSDFTACAVETLLVGEVPPVRIVVVDNSSTVAERQKLCRLADKHRCVDVVTSRDNRGYFVGLNIGIRRLNKLEPDLDYVVAGNNDLEFAPDFGKVLASEIDRLAPVAVVAPNVVTFDGVHQNPHILNEVSRVREWFYDLYYKHYLLSVVIAWIARVTYGVTGRQDMKSHQRGGFIRSGVGACYVLTQTFLKDLGYFWAPVFLMGEEYFLTMQLEERGAKIYYEPALVVRHHRHGAMRGVPQKNIWEFSRQSHQLRRHYAGRCGMKPVRPIPSTETGL